MAPAVSLRAVVDQMIIYSDPFHAYLNKRTGDLVTVSDEELEAADREDDLDGYPGWQRDQIRLAQAILESDDYLPLPDKFDIDEYRIMERFCYSLEDERLSDELCSLIRGSGAFRRFKDAIHRHGIADDWYRYRDEALREIAIDWLQAHGIDYTE